MRNRLPLLGGLPFRFEAVKKAFESSSNESGAIIRSGELLLPRAVYDLVVFPSGDSGCCWQLV